MIGGTTALNSGRLPEPFVSEIYGDPAGVTGGLGRPSGTGTLNKTDYVVENVVVPAGRWVSMTAEQPPLVEGPLYRFSMLGALAAGVAGVCLGLAARAVDELVLLGSKVPDASRRSLAERPVVQAELAQADAAVRSARAFLSETVSACWGSACEGQITDEDKRLLRLAANNAL